MDGRRIRRMAIPVAVLVVVVVSLVFVPTVATRTPGGGPGGSGSGTAVVVPAGVTPPAAPGSAGTTVGGVVCKAGVRQVPWSVYAPECVPAYRGDNGGATSEGVTRTSIAVTYRLASSAALSQIYALFPKAIVGDNEEAVSTLQAYIKAFNKGFELYGRHVVLKTYQGNGNFLTELVGGGQVEAQQDSTTEQGMGTFADDSLADSSPIFVNDLASKQIISLTLWAPDKGWFLQQRPYAYATGPDCDKRSAAAAAFARQLNGLPAAFAGDPSMTADVRRFAYVYQGTPYEQACEKLFLDAYGRYRLPDPVLASYTFDFASFLNQTDSIVAKLKGSGVTTVFMAADPISPIFFLQAAEKQNYFPEWVYLPIFANGAMNADPLGTLPPQDEMAHAFTLGIVDQKSSSEQEAHKVFETGCALPPATPCNDPLPPLSLGVAYSTMLLLFSGFQAAGPDLTDANFARGLDGVMGGQGGMYGKWSFGPATTDPPASFQVMRWQTGATSLLDGGKGAFVPCDGGKQYLYSRPELPVSRQPTCEGP